MPGSSEQPFWGGDPKHTVNRCSFGVSTIRSPWSCGNLDLRFICLSFLSVLSLFVIAVRSFAPDFGFSFRLGFLFAAVAISLWFLNPLSCLFSRRPDFQFGPISFNGNPVPIIPISVPCGVHCPGGAPRRSFGGVARRSSTI